MTPCQYPDPARPWCILHIHMIRPHPAQRVLSGYKPVSALLLAPVDRPQKEGEHSGVPLRLVRKTVIRCLALLKTPRNPL